MKEGGAYGNHQKYIPKFCSKRAFYHQVVVTIQFVLFDYLTAGALYGPAVIDSGLSAGATLRFYFPQEADTGKQKT